MHFRLLPAAIGARLPRSPLHSPQIAQSLPLSMADILMRFSHSSFIGHARRSHKMSRSTSIDVAQLAERRPFLSRLHTA